MAKGKGFEGGYTLSEEKERGYGGRDCVRGDPEAGQLGRNVNK